MLTLTAPAARLALVALIGVVAQSVSGQGQLVFDNRVNNIVVAPIYGLESSNPTLSKRGNTPAGTPSGTQTYTGAPLEGTGYLAQLFGGPLHAAAKNLQPIFPVVAFRTGTGAGFILPPPATVTVPGVPEGVTSKVQMRVWNTRGGTITNWAQVEVDPTIPYGESWPFVTGPLGGPFRAPPNLAGLQSFNLVTGATPGLVLRINFQPSNAPVPIGYHADTGLVFGARGGGLRYGWNADHQAAARARNAATSPDVRHDTFIEMGSNSVWELEVPVGAYAVHFGAGDPLVTNVQTRLALEGIVALQGATTPTQRWAEGDVLLQVDDGRLSLTGFPPPVTNRLCFMEVTRLEPVRLETSSHFDGRSEFIVRFTGEAGFRYQIETSTSFPNWQNAGPAAALYDSRFQFADLTFAYSNRFYRAHQLLNVQ